MKDFLILFVWFFLLMISSLSYADALSRENISIFNFNGESYIPVGVASTPIGLGGNANRLDVNFKEIDKNPTEARIRIEISASWYQPKSDSSLIVVMHSLFDPSYHPSLFEIKCKKFKDYCTGRKESFIATAAKYVSYYPFDEIVLHHKISTMEETQWKEITFYNRVEGMKLKKPFDLISENGILIVKAELNRFFIKHVVLFFILILWVFILFKLLISEFYFRFFVNVFGAVLLITFFVRTFILNNSLVLISAIDYCFLLLIFLSIVVLLKRTNNYKVPKKKIFISYRRIDASTEARLIYDRVVKAFGGKNVFLDNYSIFPTTKFPDEIKNSIEQSEVFLLLIGPTWLVGQEVNSSGDFRAIDNEDDWPKKELMLAFEKKLKIIPILVRGFQMPDSLDIPEEIREVAEIDALEIKSKSLESDLQVLVDIIRSSLS